VGQFEEWPLWLILDLTGTEMKDQSRYHACPNGNDCASPPIQNSAEGENHQSWLGSLGRFGWLAMPTFCLWTFNEFV
jgi:hypothetical protein